MRNKTLLIMIFSGVCLLFAVFSGCGGRPGEKEYNKAMASWEGGDLVRAQSQLEKAIRKLSGNEKKSVANNQLGIIRWNLGKHGQAIESFSESCRLAEDLSGANLNLGIALYHAGQLEQAKFEFTKILGEQPTNTVAQSFLGLVRMQKNDWQGASKELTAGLRTNPNDAATQNALALVELHLNRNSDAAVKRLKKLVAAYPEYAPAAYNLAVIHDQWLHNNSAALGWYKQYLQKTGGEGAHTELARQAIIRLNRNVQDTAGATPEKQADLEAAAQHIAQGSKLHVDKKYRKAVEQYEKAIKADPSQVTAHYNLGLSLYELKQYREAAQACLDALKLDPNSEDARYMLALSYAQQHKWGDAKREAKALKKLDAKRGESLLEYISDARNR
ncbi:MAG: tetratricopeptide repeat protein [Verrucomicrobiota bacterium]